MFLLIADIVLTGLYVVWAEQHTTGTVQSISAYSQLSNKRTGWNKRAGGIFLNYEKQIR